MDAAFRPAEVAGIADGMASWERAVDGLHLTQQAMAHEAIKLPRAPVSGDIYIYRATDGNDDGCYFGPLSRKNAVGRAGTWNEVGYICLDAAYLGDNDAVRWKRVALHELGHTFGLYSPNDGHQPAPSVMTARFDDIAEEPTDADADAVRKSLGLYGTPFKANTGHQRSLH